MDEWKAVLKERLAEIFKNETQEVISRKLNMTQGNISKWVSGPQIPTADTLLEISKAYKVSVDWLLGISDQKEIDGVVVEKLTYEQVARILDRLLENGSIEIPDLNEVHQEEDFDYDFGDLDEEESDGSKSKPEPVLDSDYLKIKDRILSYMMRRRKKIYEIGPDMVVFWKDKSLPNFKGVKIADYTGNMEEAIDTKGWANFQDDALWIETIRELSEMTEEERQKLIDEANQKEKDGEDNGREEHS